MPDEPFVPEDALEFTGVAIPATREESERSLREMAQCFIEEYVRMGYSGEFILQLCRNPFYRGLYAIRQAKGEAFLQALVDEAERAWRPRADSGSNSAGPHATGGTA